MPSQKTSYLYGVTIWVCVLNRVLFFEENWNLKVKAVSKT